MHTKIAVFDFDGTLTKKDSFLAFLIHSKGLPKVVLGGIMLLKTLLFYKIGSISNEHAKQKVFSFFFKNTPEKEFNTACEKFKPKLDRILRTSIWRKLMKLKLKDKIALR